MELDLPGFRHLTVQMLIDELSRFKRTEAPLYIQVKGVDKALVGTYLIKSWGKNRRVVLELATSSKVIVDNGLQEVG